MLARRQHPCCTPLPDKSDSPGTQRRSAIARSGAALYLWASRPPHAPFSAQRRLPMRHRDEKEWIEVLQTATAKQLNAPACAARVTHVTSAARAGCSRAGSPGPKAACRPSSMLRSLRTPVARASLGRRRARARSAGESLTRADRASNLPSIVTGAKPPPRPSSTTDGELGRAQPRYQSPLKL